MKLVKTIYNYIYHRKQVNVKRLTKQIIVNQSAVYFYKQCLHCAVPENIHTHTKEMVIGNSERGGGGGVISKPKFLKENMKLYWKFQGVGGSKPKNHPWGKYGYYLEPHILIRLPLNY